LIIILRRIKVSF